MSATKEIKTLLQELRQQLDEESQAKVEPVLRAILESAKPRTVTEVEYRSDPKDKAEIESLRTALASKDEAMRKLQARLPGPTPLLDHLSFDELVNELDEKGQAWCECLAACVILAERNDAFRRRRKVFLDRSLRVARVNLGNYLKHLERCDRVDSPKLMAILDENCLRMLNQIADEIDAAWGIRVDLEMPLLVTTARVKAAATQNVVVVGGAGAPANGAPPARPVAAAKKPPRGRRRAR
ncbi:MAG TPA: hypothetical protein VNH11_08745 [Pirellulales bacterium]|nr:hypothetical protein [Pirellulales bacterium]